MRKINSLTSLRFIAAAMIVVLHSYQFLGRVGILLNTFALVQGVSFFFVLSGFILTYVYPALNNRDDIGRYFIARFARIWPAHFFSLIIVFILFPVNGPLTLLTNLLMVHSWVPLKDYYFSFNSVSWSISTEFFFYLSFPILIYNWKHNWRFKLVSVGLLLLLIIYLCYAVNLPPFSAEERRITTASLVYIHPLGRIFEFVLGMTTALLFEKYINRVHLSRVTATIIETLTIILTVVSLKYSKFLAYHFIIKYIGRGGADWLAHNGSCFMFALLIFIITMEKGLFSELLSYRLPVLLGEISYSMYLVHQIIFRFYTAHLTSSSDVVSSLSIYIILWIVILSISYLIWYFIECPSRKFIVSLWPKKVSVLI